MSYVNANECLPEDLVKVLQKYIQGKYLYIPKEEKDEWGSNTPTKALLKERNEKIYDEYNNGVSSNDLASTYFLSVKTIQRIVRSYKHCET